MVIVVEKFRFRIRTRDGMLVENLHIPASCQEEAERKLRQIYRGCTILQDAGQPSESGGQPRHRPIVGKPLRTGGEDEKQLEAALAESLLAFEDIAELIGRSIGNCGVVKVGQR
jgi:hypothetical protein